MYRFNQKIWWAWGLTAIFGLLVANSAASGQNTWMQGGPREFMRENQGKVFRGPQLEPGRYMVWVAARQDDTQMPYPLWRAHGPFDATAGQHYLVTLQGGAMPIATWSSWHVLDATEESLATVHFLNQLSATEVYGVMVTPMGQPIPRLALTDALTATDPLEPLNQTPHRSYPMLFEQGKTYVIEMRSQEFDSYLMVRDDHGGLLAQNDENIVLTPDAMNSRITFRPQTTAIHQVIATAFAPTGVGSFSIQIREVPVMMRMEDRLATTDEVHNYCYSRQYEVALTAGRRYFIDLNSSDFATCVKLLNADGSIVAFDEGGSMDMNTRIASFEPTVSGTYRIVVSSFAENATGAFVLTVREDE